MKLPEPFLFEAGPRAVLLLHGFTGHSADVRMLGRFLEKNGYTAYAPILSGHGVAPEELMTTTPDDWWKDVQAAYLYLQEKGYTEIAVAGLSLGGALSIKLANCERVKAVIPMCAPVYSDNEQQLTGAFKHFATQFKQFEQKDAATIEAELVPIMAEFKNMFPKIAASINEVKEHVETIYTPTFVVQATYDKIINPESAAYIFENVEAEHKLINWYDKSGHVITLGEEKEQLHEDIYAFLESLNWE